MTDPTPSRSVAVITGAGGMGLATARRISTGRLLLLADVSQSALDQAQTELEDEGHVVQTHVVDVSDPTSVAAFADAAAKAGRIEVVVHTAGISPVMASSRKILEVDLLGTALIIDAFQPILASSGGSMVCIASMAGYMLPTPLTPTMEAHFATSAPAQLLTHDTLREVIDDNHQRMTAYSTAKRANHLRVQAAAHAFGRRGCRINSVSPGVIHTAMVREELESPGGDIVKRVVQGSAVGRFGTAADVVNVVSFLLSAESTFITGTDFVVDGGSLASQRWGCEGSGDESIGREYDEVRSM